MITSQSLEPTALNTLTDLLRGRRIVALVGAGCSTESGIPDYRGPEGSHRTRKPIQYQEFVGSEAARIRYWARSAVGWRRIATARPNAAHEALAQLETAGLLAGIITQNVDGLHHAAGNRRIVELHGSLAAIRCLACHQVMPRHAFQELLLEMNPGWADRLAPWTRHERIEAAPDGDAELPAWALDSFRVPACNSCDGILKPDVVFFGENVPAATLEAAWGLFGEAEVLLVVGSSLTVYSGRRFLYRARDEALPVGIINIGPTRADEMAAVKVNGPLGIALPRLAEALLDGSGGCE